MRYLKIIIFLYTVTSVACSSFLDEKPDISLQEPSTLDDLEALLNHENTLNGYLPSIGEIASDYYYLDDQAYASRLENARLYYVWDPDALTDNTWTFSMNQIFYHNLVLDRVDHVEVGNLAETDRNRIKGTATFMRAMVYFNLALIYAEQYIPGTNGSMVSIPLKMSPDINEVVRMASLEELFSFIETELLLAADLLPIETTLKTKPNQLAAKTLLSRYYLSLGRWEESIAHAKSALEFHQPALLDFNQIDVGRPIPFSRQNEETLFYMTVSGNESVFSPSFANVDTVLFRSYEDADLRRQAFFTTNNNRTVFKGSYTGANNSTLFGGITTAELYLNLSECYIRLGQVETGLSYLNVLLQNRYGSGQFVPYNYMEQRGALDLVRLERMKEMCFKGGIRWMDLKRYSIEPDSDIVLRRTINGQTHILDINQRPVPFQLPQIVRENMEE